MSLDQNLFTLVFTQNKDYPDVTDLVDPSGTIHYHKRRVAGSEYKIEVYDPLSEALLITAVAPNASAKVKTLELHNPTMMVELKSTGTLTFKWSFKWEEHEFEWKREQCFLVRKPDPPVLVAVTKEPTGRLKTQQVQILDYNINRFDVNDRKGLEIVMLTALMTFHDSNDAYHDPSQSSSSASETPAVSRRTSVIPNISFGTRGQDAPPPPPKPAPKTGVGRIAEIQAQNGDYNEVIVEEEGSVNDWASYCNNLLQDDAMLFVTIKSSSATTVPKVLQVVEETRRMRYKAGLDDEKELYQYVLYDVDKKKEKGPKRINLNDDADQKAKYAPPGSLMIHLSKIDMPELQPKSQPSSGTIRGKTKAESSPKAQQPPAQQPPATLPIAQPKPQKPASKPPAMRPTSPSSPGGSKQKPPKNKLTRPPREEERKQYYSPPVPSPGTGTLNAAPPTVPSAGAAAPKFPQPNTLYSSYTPPNPAIQSPSGSAYNYAHPNVKPAPPPPPPPTNFLGQFATNNTGSDGKHSKTAAITNMATSTAQTLVSGVFDKLNKRK